MLLLIWLVVLVAALVLYIRQAYSRFNRSDVKHLKPTPLLGDLTRTLFKLEHQKEAVEEAYNKFPGERFFGRYEFTAPIVVVRDLELIKKVTVKDFDHFVNHRGLEGYDQAEYFARHLFSLRDDEWKDMRSTLSPAFTSAKIRLMLPFMVEVGDQMGKALKKKIQASDSGYIDVDVKDLTSRYATDVIATCAFGLKVDSHADQDNEFYVMGTSSMKFNIIQQITLLMMTRYPTLAKNLKLPIMSEKIKRFFRQLILGTMKNREANNIVRPDLVEILMQAKKGQLSHEEITKDADAGFATVEESAVGKTHVQRAWTDHDLVAQAVLFFVAGFETVSTAMCFVLYELAINPDIQDRLVQEIREHDEKNHGKFDYSSVQKMTYMDMVVSETLRLWPPVPFIDRNCSKDYNLGSPNDKTTKEYTIYKGELLYLPFMAIHRDPAHYPDPTKFDPERFSPENKHKINPLSYLPFGAGPRNCIGSRFALCEVKVMLYQLLQNFELSPAAKTTIPAKIDPSSLFMRIEGGHWIRFKERK